MKHELDHLLRDLAQLRAIMEKEGPLSYLERAICETVKNEILRREDLRDGEMRIRTESDVRKSVGYLFFVMKKLKWPQIQVRAIGPAIATMNKILEEFKNTIKGYSTDIKTQTQRIFGGNQLQQSIICVTEIVRADMEGKRFYGDEPLNEEEY